MFFCDHKKQNIAAFEQRQRQTLRRLNAIRDASTQKEIDVLQNIFKPKEVGCLALNEPVKPILSAAFN